MCLVLCWSCLDNEGPPASLKVAVVRHSYVAQPGSPGGFKELSVRKGNNMYQNSHIYKFYLLFI